MWTLTRWIVKGLMRINSPWTSNSDLPIKGIEFDEHNRMHIFARNIGTASHDVDRSAYYEAEEKRITHSY